jgi:hypothetical protein
VGRRSATDWVLNRALFERAADPSSDLTVRNDGMIHSGLDPISAKVAPEQGSVSPFPQASVRQAGEANQNPGTSARPILKHTT